MTIGPRGPDDLHKLAHAMLEFVKALLPVAANGMLTPQAILRMPTGETQILWIPEPVLAILLETERGKAMYFGIIAERIDQLGATAAVLASEVVFSESMLVRNRLQPLEEPPPSDKPSDAIAVQAESAAGCVFLLQRFERQDGRVVFGDRGELFFTPPEYTGASKLFNRVTDPPN